ncbi:transposase [Lyngbya sp. PCC 8106]|nr:transposase [Lyngbya sp. PCC 8106]
MYKSGQKKPSNAQLQKQFITQAKKTVEREWLKEVSNIPLQQSLNDLEQAYKNFFKSCNRKGRKARSPKFKKRNAKQSARFRVGGFKLDGSKTRYKSDFKSDFAQPSAFRVSLAKIGNLKIVWSRPLTSEPSSFGGRRPTP